MRKIDPHCTFRLIEDGPKVPFLSKSVITFEKIKTKINKINCNRHIERRFFVIFGVNNYVGIVRQLRN